MDRRAFLSLISAGTAGLALKQVIPFGRVWSFPSKITLAKRCFNRDGYETNDGLFISTHSLCEGGVASFNIGDIITVGGLPGITFGVDAISPDQIALRGRRT